MSTQRTISDGNRTSFYIGPSEASFISSRSKRGKHHLHGDFREPVEVYSPSRIIKDGGIGRHRQQVHDLLSAIKSEGGILKEGLDNIKELIDRTQPCAKKNRKQQTYYQFKPFQVRIIKASRYWALLYPFLTQNEEGLYQLSTNVSVVGDVLTKTHREISGIIGKITDGRVSLKTEDVELALFIQRKLFASDSRNQPQQAELLEHFFEADTQRLIEIAQ